MASHLATARLVIAGAGTISGSLGTFWGVNPARVALDHARELTIKTPTALTGVVTVEVAQKKNPVAADFAVLADDTGTDVVLTTNRSEVIDVPSCTDLRLVSSLAEGAEREFYVSLREDT